MLLATLAALAAAAALLLSLLVPGDDASAQGLVCSSFGGGPPYAFETYEASRDRQPYLAAQRLAAQNLLLPSAASFQLPAIEVGPSGARGPDPTAAIPPRLLHAIGWIESRLNQASITVPYQGTGPVLISSSCAYGLMQVASFFSNGGDLPTRAEALAGTHYAYNVAAGARILVTKWNDVFFPSVAADDPAFLESWYYAVWAYNGWAFVNHPAGAEVDPFRSPYDCDRPFNGYPYQELVFGCLRNPPSVDGVPLWDPLPVQLPDLATLARPGGPLDPDVYFDGWALVFETALGLESPLDPFARMLIPLPAGAIAVPPLQLDVAVVDRDRDAALGAPNIGLNASALELRVTDQTTETGALSITNTGSGILTYRVAAAPSWLLLSVPAGVAVGDGVGLISGQQAASSIVLVPDAEGLREGLHQATIIVEGLLPDGTVITKLVSVVLDKQGAPIYRAGTPQS